MAKSRVRKKTKRSKQRVGPRTIQAKEPLLDIQPLLGNLKIKIKVDRNTYCSSIPDLLEKFSKRYLKGENFSEYTNRRNLTLKQLAALELWMKNYGEHIGFTQ